MRMFLLVLTVTSWITSLWALQASEAGVVDWHKTFIGVPRTDNPESSPVFHRVETKHSTKSVVLTTTENTNVLAALDPVDGSIAWRFIFEENDPVLSFQKHGNVVAALSGIGGSHLRLFDSIKGDLILEKQLHSLRAGHLLQPRHLGVSIAFVSDDSSDLFVLTNGHTLYRVDGSTGEASWVWTSPDEASLVVYERIVVSGSTVYAIGLAKSFASYTLHVAALSSGTGELLTSSHISSNIANGPQDFFSLTRSIEQNPLLVWLDKGVIKHVALTPELANKPISISGFAHEQIINLGLGDKGFFVARRKDGSSYVYKLDGAAIQQTWEFAGSATSEQHTDSLYTGGLDKDGNPYVGRLYWSHAHQAATLHVYAPHLLQGKGLVSGFTFPFETNQYGTINHFALDVVNPEGLKVLARVALTTSTGSVQLWLDNTVQWTREEALSGILLAEFVELPEQKTITSHLGEEGETFVHRLLRQVSDAQDFPRYLIAFTKRFATGSYASASSPVAVADSSEPLSRDEFGFKKIIVVANRYGKIYGLDSSNGKILWSRILSFGPVAAVGGFIVPLKMFVTRAVTDGDTPQVVLVTRRHGYHGVTDTVVFHFDPLTGKNTAGTSADDNLLRGVDIFSGSPLEVYMLEAQRKIVALVDSEQQVHLYPNTPENLQVFSEIPSIHFPVRTSDHGVQGFQVLSVPNLEGKFATFPTWSMFVPRSEIVDSIIHSSKGPVASLGKVLGNRTTLYKYLNPHLFAVTTVPKPPASGSCSIYLVDGVKGSIIYHTSIANNGGCKIEAVLTENWLVYSYYDEEYAGVGQTKGHRVVSVEIYEGKVLNDKTRSSDMSSFSNKTLEVNIYERAFGSYRGISTMTPTSTKFGITTKDIIAATKNNQIQSIPRRLLDPRRPKDKPSAQEQEEMLLQYDPNLPIDPRHTISHNYEVANTRKIVTSPALLESTSLVFAFGIDLFFTRVAPSNTFDVLSENFNKLQLVLTVGGLAVAIMITRPMVYRKRLRERWYQ